MIDNIFSEIQSKKGLDMVVEETQQFDRIVKGVYEVTARNVYGTENPKGLAVFAYGSPGRIEMVGGDSDADILLCEDKKTQSSRQFRELFKRNLGLFDFSKVDLTEWGTYDEIEIYLQKSLVEGNQILESRPLIGDIEVINEIEKKKKAHDSIQRGLRNIIINRLYLNQYFKQKVRGRAINIKYCIGGSREFLFLHWYDLLSRIIDNEQVDSSYQPRVKVGIERLFNDGQIVREELVDAFEAINFSITLRSDVLKMNKKTIDKGLTFLDEETLERIQMIGYPKSDFIKSAFELYRQPINKISQIVLDQTIKRAGQLKDQEWELNFRKALSLETFSSERETIPSQDSLTRIALIWGASESKQKTLFEHLAEMYRDTEDWATIGSIVCSPHCPAEILNHFGTGIAKEAGYGYLLRVIARNKNTKRETLRSIAEDRGLEKRYTEVAKAVLEGGHSSTNNQI